MTTDGYGKAYQRGFEVTVRFLLSRGLQRDTASEVAQAAWVRGWERLNQLHDETLVVAWVNTIALNVYRRVLRREPLNLAPSKLRDGIAVIDLAAIDMARVLGFCRPRDRMLLEQCLKGSTTAEIAHEHGVSVTAIRVRLLRARRYARSRVERRSTVQCAA
jgi:DNA-directed RNA polymerase specialized sigma24 family protein